MRLAYYYGRRDDYYYHHHYYYSPMATSIKLMMGTIMTLQAIITVILTPGAVYAFDGGADIQFDFTQRECLDGTTVAEVTGNGIMGPLNLNQNVSCLRGTGITASDRVEGQPAAYSTDTIAAFLNLMREPEEFPGFALEVWITIDDTECDSWTDDSVCTYPIFTIGTPVIDENDEFCHGTANLQLDYVADWDNIQIQLRHSEDECETVSPRAGSIPKESRGYPLQIVTTPGAIFSPTYGWFETMDWYYNGTLVAHSILRKTGGEALIQAWHEDYTVQILDKVRWPWSDWYDERMVSVHRARLFAHTLDEDTVAELYAEGVANSIPYVYNVTAELKEDGELGKHYDDPKLYYDVFPPSELDHFYLDYYDSDLDPTTANYINTTPRAFLSSLPSNGHIIDLTGEPVLELPYEFPNDRNGTPVKFRPLFNEYSSDVYTKFTYYIVDGVTGERSFGDYGTVTIYVRPVNDPPVATQGIFLHAYAGIRRNVVGMWGFDVDIGDEVQGVEIVDLPSNGNLYQIYKNDTISPVRITYSGESVWDRAILAYQVNSSLLQSNSPDDQLVGLDTFSFRVLDSDGNRSFPAPVSIEVYTGVFAGSDERAYCYEDEDCDIMLFGTALDDSRANMMYTITDVPLNGVLFDAAGGTIITPGITLAKQTRYPYQDGVTLVYRPSHDFFNDPVVTWLGDRIDMDNETESVSFYASLVDGDAVLSSPVFRQAIRVTNVDDTSKLVCSGEKNLQVRATQTDKEFNYSRDDRVVFTNITVDNDYDKGVDPVRVDITIHEGNVFLNPLYRDLMDFSFTCAGLYSTWRCRKIDFLQKTMTFIGTPEDAARAMNGMVYYNQYEYASSDVIIEMYDGEGGSCIDSEGFSTISVRPECKSSSCTFQVEVGAFGADDDEEEKGWIRLNLFTLKVIAVSAFGVLTLVLIKIDIMLLKYLLRLVCPCLKLGKNKDEKKGAAAAAAAAAGDDVQKGEQPVSPPAAGDAGKGGTKADQTKVAVTGDEAKSSSQGKPADESPKSNQKNAKADNAKADDAKGRPKSKSRPKSSAKASASDKDGPSRGRGGQGWAD